MLGTADISTLGEGADIGTVTGALSKLNSDMVAINSDLANTCILSEVAVTAGQELATTIMINQFNKLYFIIGANGGIRASCYVFPASFILKTLADKEYIISSDEVVEGYTAFIQFYINRPVITGNKFIHRRTRFYHTIFL